MNNEKIDKELIEFGRKTETECDYFLDTGHYPGGPTCEKYGDMFFYRHCLGPSVCPKTHECNGYVPASYCIEKLKEKYMRKLKNLESEVLENETG